MTRVHSETAAAYVAQHVQDRHSAIGFAASVRDSYARQKRRLDFAAQPTRSSFDPRRIDAPPRITAQEHAELLGAEQANAKALMAATNRRFVELLEADFEAATRRLRTRRAPMGFEGDVAYREAIDQVEAIDNSPRLVEFYNEARRRGDELAQRAALNIGTARCDTALLMEWQRFNPEDRALVDNYLHLHAEVNDRSAQLARAFLFVFAD